MNKHFLLLLLLLIFTGCPDNQPANEPETQTISGVPIVEELIIERKPFDDNYTYESKKELTTDTIDESGVLLQGFHWDSCKVANKGWYKEISDNKSEISNTFSIVWFPPSTISPDFAPQGYGPTQLNNLDSQYGSKSELKQAISDIAPAKAIGDIVINHRAGSANWGTFTNPIWDDDFYSICSEDEGFTQAKGDPMFKNTKRGSPDTGEVYSAFRDLDHTNAIVKKGIIDWMYDLMRTEVGFKGWRYDYVKGFDGKYIGLYNKETYPEFSVGEYWPTKTFNSSEWSTAISDWINKTANIGGVKSRAFDFVLKGNLNEAFGTKTNSAWNMTKLNDENNIFRKDPSHAVTFVDNHDTGSTQSHWPIYHKSTDSLESHVYLGYVFILTHPGYPAVAWQHYFKSDVTAQFISDMTIKGYDKTLKELIKELIELRKSTGLKSNSTFEIVGTTTSDDYTAMIDDKLIIRIGKNKFIPDAGWTLKISGDTFQIFTKD